MVVFCFFLLFFTCMASEGTSRYHIDLSTHISKDLEEIENFLPTSILVNKVHFITHDTVSEHECQSITGWKTPFELNKKALTQGLMSLSKKKLFKSIDVVLKKEQDHTLLECICDPLIVVTKIEHKGILFGKEQYFSYYDLQVGEVFLQEKHEAALKKVKEEFHKQGYSGAQVIDTVKFNDDKNEVTIVLDCQRGKRFTVSHLDFSISSFDGKKHEILIDELHEKFDKKLLKQSSQEKHILDVLSNIEVFLGKQGFIEPVVTYVAIPNYDTHTVTLKVKIKLGKQRLFTFVGNTFYSSNELSELLTKSGNTVWLLPPTLLAQDITLLYRKKGFWNVSVKVEKSNQELFFIITQGERILVKDVVCKGLPEYQTRHSFSHFFKNVMKQKYFDEDVLQQSIDKLLTFYKQAGFWDITLTKKNYEQQGDTQEYVVVLIFNPGEQRTVNRVVIKDFKYLERRGPFARINGKNEAFPLTKSSVQEQQAWLLEYFRKKGHAQVQVFSTFDRDKDGSYLVWNIEHLETIYHGKTIVQGKSPIDYEKLLTFVDYKEGDEWRKESLLNTYSNLRALDIFKYIALYPDAYDSTNLTRDVILHVQEDDPYELRLRFGFQQVSKNFAFKKGSTYKVGTTFMCKNITHNADTLRLDADFSKFARKIDLSYQLPHPFLSPFTILTKVYANKYTQPVAIGSRKTLYEATQEGFLTSISGDYHSINYGTNIGFEWMKTKDISQELAQAINFKTDLINKKIPYFFVEPTLFVDMLDDKINPSRGIFALASLKAMVPFKEQAYFVKIMVEQGLFFPLTKYYDIVCAARVRFGHIFNETFSKIMPPERFYLGGANSLRGYLPDACPPLGSYIDVDTQQKQYVPQGGKTMVNMNFEVRIPFTPTLMMAVFQDFGVLVEDIATLHESSNTATSTGLGIRYLTPIGPLRFDIGFKWRKTYPDEPGYAWFLTLGHAF